jgi:hypothetical protein
LRRPEEDGECESTLSKRLNMVFADLEDVAITLAEAKEEPLSESHRKLSDAEEDLEKAADALERIGEEERL